MLREGGGGTQAIHVRAVASGCIAVTAGVASGAHLARPGHCCSSERILAVLTRPSVQLADTSNAWPEAASRNLRMGTCERAAYQ